MFPNEQLAFAQFIPGEHSALLDALCGLGNPRSLPGAALLTTPQETRPLQPVVGAGFPAKALGRGQECSAGRTKLGTGDTWPGPSQVQRPQFICPCWGPKPHRPPSFQTSFHMAETDRSTEDHNLNHFDLDFAVA